MCVGRTFSVPLTAAGFTLYFRVELQLASSCKQSFHFQTSSTILFILFPFGAAPLRHQSKGIRSPQSPLSFRCSPLVTELHKALRIMAPKMQVGFYGDGYSNAAVE